MRIPGLLLAIVLTSASTLGAGSEEDLCGDLQPAWRIERELNGDSSHRWRVVLEEGDFLQVAVQQLRSDVTLVLTDSRGIQQARADTPMSRQGTERVSMIADRRGEVHLDIRLGLRETDRGRYIVAIEQLRPAEPLDSQRVAAARAFDDGERLRGEGGAEKLRAAVDAYGRALALWKESGDLEMIAATHHQRGYVRDLLGNYPEALTDYLQALTLQEATNSPRLAETLSNLGVVYRVTGNQAKAQHHYERALELRRANGDIGGEASTLHNLGTLFWSQGEIGRAGEYYSLALIRRREAGDRAGEAETLMGLGLAARVTGDPQKALATYAEALAIKEAIGDRRGVAAVLHNRGVVYSTLGEFDRALEHYDRSLRISRQEGDRSWEAAALVSSGIAAKFLGEYERSLNFFTQALAVRRALGRKREEAEVLTNLGLLHEILGRPALAAELYDQALPIHREVQDRRGEAFTLGNIGTALGAAGQAAKGIASLRAAADIQRSIRDENAVAESLLSIAQIERDRGELAAARATVEEAIQIIESFRGRIPSPSLRSTYRALKHSQYAVLVDVLMRLHAREPQGGHDLEALVASERARARTLREMLAESRIDLLAGIDQALLTQRTSVLERLTRLERDRGKLTGGKHTPEQLAEIDAQIENALAEHDEVEGRVRASSAKYAALLRQESIDGAGLERLLDTDTLLVEYALGVERSYAWALSDTGLFSAVLPGSRTIEAAVRRVLDLIAAGPRREVEVPLRQAIAALSDMILAPLATALGNRRLLVVADGPLQYIPFAALNDPASPQVALITRHEIVMLPSAGVLPLIRENANSGQERSVVVFADPVLDGNDSRVARRSGSAPAREPASDLSRSARDVGIEYARLPYTRREAELIMRLTRSGKSRLATDFEASREKLLSTELNEFRILHFATHGLINNKNPDLSGIVLSLVDEQGGPQDGFVRLRDIYRLELDADLVVLSACSSALGRDIRGEGLMGLTRGFMYAGARGVMASLWNVRDQATAELMQRFYRGLLKENLSAAAALRAAQRSMAKEPRWRSPYYWAPFVLQADWR